MPDKTSYFIEIDRHLTEDKKPSDYLTALEKEGLFSGVYPFTLLGELKKTEQNPVHHPEGNVWNHTLLVVDNAAFFREQSSAPKVFMWSALLHDIGKPGTTKIRKGRITAYNHDTEGEKLAGEFLRVFTRDEDFIYKVSKMVRWHMQMLMVVKNLPFADINRMLKEVSMHEIALLAMCDRLGRGEITEELIDKEKKNVSYFLKKCSELKEKK